MLGDTWCRSLCGVGKGPFARPASTPQRKARFLQKAMGVSVGIAALLFDLDNTLLLTDALEGIRRTRKFDLLEGHLEDVGVVDGLAEVLSRVSSRDNLKLGIVTRSPREYATRLLAHFFPDVQWDVIVAGKEAVRYKPHPDGLKQALDKLGVSPQQAAYVGDDRGDMEAAYHARVMPVLALFKRRLAIENRHGKLVFRGPLDYSIVEEPAIAEDLKIAPAALLWNPDDVEELVENPDEWTPLVEAWGTIGRKPEKLRWLPVACQSPVADISNVTAAALGRYFPRRGGTAIHHRAHALSREVAQKEKPPFYAPDHWIEALSRLTEYLVSNLEIDVVTVIPAKAGKDPRLERILQRVAANPWTQGLAAEFVEDVFEIGDVTNTRALRAKDKLEHLLSELKVKRPDKVSGRSVLVFDDVVTTGSTFLAAAALLSQAGAAECQFIALAKTVSDTTFVVSDEEEICDDCKSPMEKRINGKDGSLFWGCTAYPDCQFTKDIVT